LIKFYSSPSGKKLLEKESQAQTHVSQLVKNKLHEQMPQIIAWFQQVLNSKLSN
jgi:hypothetical protein